MMNQLIPRKLLLFSFFLTFLLTACSGNTVSLSVPNDQDKPENLMFKIKELYENEVLFQLAEGVFYTEITVGELSPTVFFTVDIGFFENIDEAEINMKNFQKNGYDSWIHVVTDNHYDQTDIDSEIIGYVVRSGKFAHEADAEPLLDTAKNAGYENAQITYSEFDGTKKTNGPFKMNIIELNPQTFNGQLTNVLAHDQIPGRERLSEMAERSKALAAINGGYFVMEDQDGIPGDPVGISFIDGRLVSESVGERTSLIVTGNTGKISETSTQLNLTSINDETKTIQGINRTPGLIRSCGGMENGKITAPMHDRTCTAENEIILFNSLFGDKTPEGPGFEVFLNEFDTVVAVHNKRGNVIPEEGSLLSAIGEEAEWLKKNAVIGEQLLLTTDVFAEGIKLDLADDQFLINGAPRLLKDGSITIQADKEGFNWSPEFYYYFALHRHPRTLVGIKENGNILLITVDGRNPVESVGLSFHESAELLKLLGAVEGLNLDGGGSTTMVVNNNLVNLPSDLEGERPIGEGLIILD